MKGLIVIFALFFVTVSARKSIPSETEGKVLMDECMLDKYGKDPHDMNIDHNVTQVLSCTFACKLQIDGVILNDNSLNVPVLEELFKERIAASDFPYVDVFAKTYYQCRKDYPEHCDWEVCMEKRMPVVPEPVKDIELGSQNIQIIDQQK
ncbi:uncharacterized protein LOC106649123 isoform X2 [Trichogramma pretiosum]|nr:uncharacterized protein LOC106649123 isoform X2 [Trichogramma pretiosum]